jgi:hypothetical protein
MRNVSSVCTGSGTELIRFRVGYVSPGGRQRILELLCTDLHFASICFGALRYIPGFEHRDELTCEENIIQQ